MFFIRLGSSHGLTSEHWVNCSLQTITFDDEQETYYLWFGLDSFWSTLQSQVPQDSMTKSSPVQFQTTKYIITEQFKLLESTHLKFCFDLLSDNLQ